MGGGREGKGREGGRACKSCIYQPSIIILTTTDLKMLQQALFKQ